MAEICVLALGEWLEVDVSPYLPYASAERRESVARFRHASDKNRSLWAELFTRWCLAEAAGVPISEVAIAHDEKGKPFWPGGSLSLSISHSGNYIAVAVGEETIGVDVEKKRKAAPAVAKRWFRLEENTLLESLSEAERSRLFFRLWTVKEAALKYAGEGLSGGIENVDCLALIEAARSGAEDELAGQSFALDGDATVSVVARCDELPTEARLFALEAVKQGVYGDANFAERATI
ncbi:MAG: 4'-phosphopantetheinyl transferase superfamily protein, partial [Schwartzia sp.]|nr:4'-phosphopantetheinyl transferase superfamily protein [Schwartzia sp. (in: firmicutes)]